MTMDYAGLKRQIYDILDIDLNAYKEQQMQRRITQWLARHRLDEFSKLGQVLQDDPVHRAKFREYLTINTSHFFRDQGVFETLENQILPTVAGSGRLPRIWSAGCSIGAEAYSIAILLAEHGYRYRELLATDIDNEILRKAQSGQFVRSQLNALPRPLLDKYFVQNRDIYHLSETIRRAVHFKQHNLLKDTFPRDCDLIMCRNVFIYFTTDTQKHLTHTFMASLKPGGYFVVGSAEQIMNPSSFGLKRISYCIYQKDTE